MTTPANDTPAALAEVLLAVLRASPLLREGLAAMPSMLQRELAEKLTRTVAEWLETRGRE
jgi:hypothetical protein